MVDTLLNELMSHARNKGCVAVEAEPPLGPLGPWTRIGFIEGRQRLVLNSATHRSPA